MLQEKHWLVVGGGLQGCYFAALLSHQYQNVAILDPHPSLLHRWLQRSASCRMKFMRSTSMHHLAPNPGDLLDFAQIRGYGSEHFTEPYLRPSLALFNAHCQEILHSFRLKDMHIQGELCALEKKQNTQEHQDIWEVEYLDANAQTKVLQSQNILLALGDQGEYWGEYQREIENQTKKQLESKIWHLSSPDFSLDEVLKQREQTQAKICILGGGISSAQLALHLLQQNIQVKIHSRYPLRCFQFDSEPGWLFKFLSDFQAEVDLAKRWEIINAERHKGSVPPQLYEHLQQYQEPLLKISTSSLDDIAMNDIIILATGLNYKTPSWLLELAAKLKLPLLNTKNGPKPALQGSLLWCSGLYLTGRLGELFLGPAAGNIAGARLAARYLPIETKHSGSFLGPS